MKNKGLIKYRVVFICLALAVVTFVAFEQVRDNDFINFDDDVYVTENSNVNKGLSFKSIIWAFTSRDCANWHPLSWLSHMADCQLYGLNPTGHHITNLLLHILNVLLLFLVLWKMTDSIWSSVFVAALFAIHPLHVESVAWISERKDVLSTMFWMLTMIAYFYYTKHTNIARYLFVVILFTLGLMAKPMLVTLPPVLLLLDYWPLGRFDKFSIKRLIGEKVPLFILTIASSIITFIAQRQGGAVTDTQGITFFYSLSNSVTSYAAYLIKMLYPVNLAILYPHPGNNIPLWQPVVSLMILTVITIFCIRLARRKAYLLTGWLWYLGTLVPVIGLVRIGRQSIADRYTYIPLIGIFIIISWGLGDLLKRWKHKKTVLSISASLVILLLTLCTRSQVGLWKNSMTLHEHTLGITKNNVLIFINYGRSLYDNNRATEAVEYFEKAVKLEPNRIRGYNNLANVLVSMGEFDKAIGHYQKALVLTPDDPELHYNLAIVLAVQGKQEQAAKHYQNALRIDPDHARSHNNLGIILYSQGKLAQAVDHYQNSLRIDPYNARAHHNLGIAFVSLGKFEQAIDHYQKALQLKPDLPGPNNSLASVLRRQNKIAEAVFHWKEELRLKPNSSKLCNKIARILATTEDKYLRDPAEAISLAKRACELTGYRKPEFLDTLVVAYASAGDFPRAVGISEKALKLAGNNENLANRIRENIERYKLKKTGYNK